ncbi:unnamed protein product [Cylindrotheca closterium]|uniref:Uncharacterized protein n=1 Tax=Cylindrotheca closterium TaxID=2856 RepID=A0AAD2PUM8_9STRA|nr:unnamed protein product [Cylindrotheca closterium]
MRPPPITPFFTYTLGSSLYVPLTCRCNSLTLPETRGPNFLLPRDVVASLMRVREMELQRDDGNDDDNDNLFWEVKTIDSLVEGKQKLPSLLGKNKVQEYPDGNQHVVHPKVPDLMEEIRLQMENNDVDKTSTTKITSVVIAGEGEPTLRLNDLLSLTEQLSSSSWFSESSSSSSSIRLTTNGLIPSQQASSISNGKQESNVPQLLQSHGVSHVSVALMSADPLQYEALMQPLLLVEEDNAHSQVCRFIQQAADTNGLEVEVTAVDRPEVNKETLESLAKSLSVENPVRWRPYFE